MIFHKLMNGGGDLAARGMSYEEIGRMTIPQLICKCADKPPETGEKFTSYAALQAAERRREEAWSATP